MRLFISIPLNTSARSQLSQAVDRLAANRESPLPAGKFKWTAPANYHLTLKFLGDVIDERIPDVVDACEGVAIDWPPSLHVDGITLEPDHGAIRLIAARVAGDVVALKSIYDQLEAEMSAAGFRREGRKFWPHITVARAKMPVHLSDTERVAWNILAARMVAGPAFSVDRLQLIDSLLERDGPTYTSMATIKLM